MQGRLFLTVFFVLNLLVSSYYLDVWRNANTTSRVLPIISYFESGTFRINKYHELTVDKAFVNGHYYTDKAPLPTYVVLPVFGLLKISGIVQPDENGSLMGDPVYILGGFLVSCLPFTLLLFFLFRKIRKENGKVSSVLLSTLPFYGSFIFVFTGTYFGHLMSAICLLAGLLLIERRKYFVAGLFSGFAFLSEYNLGLIVLLWGIVLFLKERSVRKFFRYSLGVAPSLLFQIGYNAYYSTSPFTFLYKYHNFSELDKNYGFVLPDWEPIWGLTLSPYRGMFFYVPVLLTGLLILYYKVRKGDGFKILTGYLAVPFLLYFLFISSYFAWWGGWTYGPRLLLAVALILVYKIVIWVAFQHKYRTLLLILAFAGLLLILPAKGTIAYSAPTGVFNPYADLVLSGLLQNEFNPNNILTFLTGANPKVSFILFLTLFISGFGLLSVWKRKFP